MGDVTLQLSSDTAYKLERVRRTIWVSTGDHPGNDELIERLCTTFFERIAGGP